MIQFNPRVRLPGFFTKLFKEAIWRMDETRKVVYLTFDDGPIPEVTPWVLELLDKEEIKATFFCVGHNVQKYPDIYFEILSRGHSVGNHTFNHWQGCKNSNQNYFENIEQAKRLIDSDLFRPPHGLLKPRQYHYLKNNFRIMMWDLISCDYNQSFSPKDVLRNVTNYVRSGSIITFHDSLKAKQNLMYALPRSIEWMKSQGFRFEAIPYKKSGSDSPNNCNTAESSKMLKTTDC